MVRSVFRPRSQAGPFQVRTRVPTACTFGQDANRTQKGNGKASVHKDFTQLSPREKRAVFSWTVPEKGNQSDISRTPFFISFHVFCLSTQSPGTSVPGQDHQPFWVRDPALIDFELQQVVKPIAEPIFNSRIKYLNI